MVRDTSNRQYDDYKNLPVNLADPNPCLYLLSNVQAI